MMPAFSYAIAWAVREYTRDPEAREAACRAVLKAGWRKVNSDVDRAFVALRSTPKVSPRTLDPVVRDPR